MGRPRGRRTEADRGGEFNSICRLGFLARGFGAGIFALAEATAVEEGASPQPGLRGVGEYKSADEWFGVFTDRELDRSGSTAWDRACGRVWSRRPVNEGIRSDRIQESAWGV